MPNVLRVGPYRIYFFAADRNEPPHLHVRRDRSVAKFWLNPVRLARNDGFRPHELRTIEAIIYENEQKIMEAWNHEFGAE
jgi:hypothetical protein